MLVSCFSLAGIAYAGNTYEIDSRNRFLLNGDPFFPLGLYVVECPNGAYLTELDEIADSPFDTLVNYGVNFCTTPGDVSHEQILSYLDALRDKNLKLIYSLKESVFNCNISKFCRMLPERRSS